MARGSLTKRLSKMNLSKQQVAIFQRILFVGSQMAGIINSDPDAPKIALDYANDWSELMSQLAKTLFLKV